MDNGSSRDVERVSGEIETLRHELGTLVSELDRRRRELLDVRTQVRRHPVAAIAAASGVALLVGGVVAVALRNRRHRARPRVRVHEARRALARLLDHPQRVAAEPNMGVKIATAAGVAVGTAVAKRLAERFMARTLPKK